MACASLPAKIIPKSKLSDEMIVPLKGNFRAFASRHARNCHCRNATTWALPWPRALDHLHRQGLIHRDIKPSNIIYLNGHPKFTDIGLVTEIASSRDVTMVGTQGYLAPEEPTSPASDTDALGKLLYEACLGQDPRAFPDWPTKILEYPPSPQQHRFVAFLWKACDPEPDQRFASAAEMCDALVKLHGE